MIKKSLLCFLVVLAIHACLVAFFPQLGRATHQWQDNQIRAQRFYYQPQADTLLVGSSLSARLVGDSLPGVTSLAFSGCSVEDGLRIMQARRCYPRLLLVEMNVFFREPNADLIATVTTGPMPLLRRWLPSLREQYAPVCLLSPLLMDSYNANRVDEAVRAQMIRNRIADDFTLTPAEVDRRLQTLRPLFRDLEAHGTRLCFFQMPMHSEVAALNRYRQTRHILHCVFPPGTYLYLPADTTRYLTTDGEHLGPDEARRFSHFLKQQIESL